MQIIADLHLHSKYSRAVSQRMDLAEIARWAGKKGILLMATGDWTHPLWFREITQNLIEVAPGIFSLKKKPFDSDAEVYFLLSVEISSIYSQGDKQRRVHNLIFSPSIKTCEKIVKALEEKGANLLADGRPILGISSKNLLEMVLSIDEKAFFIPCHVWTPWFSLYGSKSGFDSIEECFGEMSKHIYAVETGLSSDPIMNWQIDDLKNRSIVSFSDAHSGPKIGREATVFVPKTISNFKFQILNFSYGDITDAIKQKPGGKLKIGYTIEFFPEEGKYHWSGHRNCNLRYSPAEVKKNGIICPVCKKPLTIGVENRVIQLSEKIYDHSDLKFLENKSGLVFVYDKEQRRKPFVSIVQLIETLTEVNNGSPTRALADYERLTSEFAPEFDILLKQPLEQIESHAGQKLRQAIEIIRKRRVFVDPGYDGVFGKVKIFGGNNQPGEEKLPEEKQPTLF